MADTFPKNTIDDNGLKKVWDMVMDRLGLKVDKEEGKGLSTNDYTTTEKNKLAGIESGAEVNTVTSVAGKTGAVTLDKSDVGLTNVGNFKAVSTSANQGLTDTEKSNARTNIDTPSNGDIQSSKTIKSSVVTVTDAAPNNAEDITVDITPIQDLHGYDRPWAGGGWKNKAPTLSGAVISEGITVTPQPDGSVILDGTKSSTNNVIITSPFTVKANTTYTVSIGSMPSSISDFGIQGYGNSKTITPSYDYPSNGIQLMIDQGTVLSGVRLYPQVEIGSTPTSYASYSNECPIEGRTGAELDRVGKNLFDKSIFCVNAFLQSGIVYKQGTGTCLVFDTEDLIGQTITISCSYDNRYVLTGFDVDARTLIASDEIYSGTQISTTSWTTRTFSVEYKTYVYYISNNGFKEELGGGVQLELGSTATSYEPYQGQQYTASFGETVYGGKWHVTKGGTDKTHANIANYNGETINEPWLSSLDEYSPGATPTTGAQVVYPLTTPTTISTPKQNVPMLKGINTVYADCGDVSLKYQPDNVVGELKGEIEDSIIYEDYKWTTESSRTYSAGTPGTYGCSSWRDVKKEGYDVIGVTFVENRRFGDCILTLYYIPSTSRVEVIIFRATSSSVTIADEDITYRVAYKKH